MTTSPDNTPLTSEFADDPEMADLVRVFVSELPDRIVALNSAIESGDTEQLRRLAHQLRGAGAGYGFPVISEVSGQLEDGIREGCPPSEVRVRFNELCRICSRAIPRAA